MKKKKVFVIKCLKDTKVCKNRTQKASETRLPPVNLLPSIASLEQIRRFARDIEIMSHLWDIFDKLHHRTPKNRIWALSFVASSCLFYFPNEHFLVFRFLLLQSAPPSCTTLWESRESRGRRLCFWWLWLKSSFVVLLQRMQFSSSSRHLSTCTCLVFLHR